MLPVRIFFVLALAGFIVSTESTTTLLAQDQTIVPLFDADTTLQPATQETTDEALVTRIGDRVRDRHARESEFQAYDHYLSFYWEQRSIGMTFIDRVARGGKEIEINIQSLAPLNEPNFRSFYRGQNTVAEYHLNVIARESESNHYSCTIDRHPIENRELRIGDKIEFEFSPFLLAPDNGRSNYYGTTMLYIIGKGIVPWRGEGSRLDSVALPSSTYLGGLTTLPYRYSDEPAERFKQMAGNIAPENAQPFLLGRRLHHTDMLSGAHSESPNPAFEEQAGKLGPQFIAESCIACHVNNGRALPPSPGQAMLQSVVKVAADPAGTPHPTLGTDFQPRSTTGSPEGELHLARYELIAGTYEDGTPYELRKPVYESSVETPRYLSVRLTPQLVGLGLIEAIDERDVLAQADPDDQDGDGISGRPQIVIDANSDQRRLGRFGYKAGQARLREQIAAALKNDMGVSTNWSESRSSNGPSDPVELDDTDLDHLERYIGLLGVNAQRDYDDEDVLRGERLFAKANCQACHTPSYTTSSYHPLAELRAQRIQPFTDLLLHDMGEGLADTLGENEASGSEWRTAPLWGIGSTDGVSGGEAYLHDGRARTLEEAILWHGGEGSAARDAFRKMPEADREALIDYLRSL